ncbi:protein PET100 homolog, mitochondrial [Euwallacea fornicatus]|uniref:protein PET100 homolog, mitochondrial n=1 Tax=Euwallacea fornicatus TaxID=995702 RepID=UPI00338FE6ED
MGNWQLEVGKMAMYLAFPVTMFYYFNQPSLFEEWVIKTKRELYPPENPELRKAFEESFRISRERNTVTFEREN